MSAKRHKVVTVERGTGAEGRPGYAARCEDCDAITSGGFPSRSAARQALAGHEEGPDAAATAHEATNDSGSKQESVKVNATRARDPRARISRIDQEVARLRSARRDAIAEMLDDLAFQDVPIMRIRSLHFSGTPGDLVPGDRVHVLEQIDEEDGVVRVTAHNTESCTLRWCRREGIARRTHHRHGHGHKFTFCGTWDVLTAPTPLDQSGEFICIPGGALTQPRSRSMIGASS